MPPVDRRNPIRAESSESTCYLIEFMREFPDDEACLRHVWRERFSPDGDHAHCSRCKAERVFKRYDTAQKRPCWFCSTCGFRIHPHALDESLGSDRLLASSRPERRLEGRDRGETTRRVFPLQRIRPGIDHARRRFESSLGFVR